MSSRLQRLLIVGLIACSDDSGGDAIDIRKFALNECQQSTSSSLLTGRDPSEYEGLQCIAWNFQGRQYALDLIHMPAGCGFRGGDDPTLWQPIVNRRSRGALEYDVQWNFPSANACGGCIHDFSVLIEAIELEDDVRIDTGTRSCTKCPWDRDSVQTNDERAGIRCRYGDWRELAPGLSVAGSQNQPARDDGTCEDDLRAVEVKGTTRCLAACETDHDCPIAELQDCTDGACQLSRPW